MAKKQQPQQPAGKADYTKGKKLEALPGADYDRRKHLPLKRTNFADESLWFDWQAAAHEERAKQLRLQAEDYRKMGDPKNRQRIKQLRSMQKRLDKLAQELKADGVEV